MDANGLEGIKNVDQLDLEAVKDSCRVCMSKEVEMNCVFILLCKNVADKIEFCTGVHLKQEDGLPSKICIMCLKNLSVAYKFKTSCLLAENMFKKFVTPIIKTEVPDDDMKQHYNEISMEDSDHWDDSDGFQNNKINDELLNMLGEKSLDTLKSNMSSVQDSKLQVKKKRGPYKKSKTRKNNKLMPVNKRKVDLLTCVRCKVKFENKEQLIKHKKDHHRDTECWICEICGKMLTHRASHYSHVRSHAPPQYACAQCDYKTWYKHDLVKHVRRHDGIKLFQCEYCTASYYTSSNLINHIRRIHDGEKRYQCTMCDKRFYDRAKLNRHIDSHNDIKRFKCDVCNACFSRRCYWKKHLLRQHNVQTPPQRPGRQKINFIVGQDLIDNTATLLTK